MRQARIRHPQTWGERVVVFENVPAEVCDQCGEILFSGDVVDRINRLLWSASPAARVVDASVYDLSAASGD
jgi:YgiT-type zinc finger domain-containing protein